MNDVLSVCDAVSVVIILVVGGYTQYLTVII